MPLLVKDSFFNLNIDVVFAFVLAYHFDLLHFELQFLVFFLLFRIFNVRAVLFLRLGWLLFAVNFGYFSSCVLFEVEFFENVSFLISILDLDLNQIVGLSFINEQICAFAVFFFLPIVLIFIGE